MGIKMTLVTYLT